MALKIGELYAVISANSTSFIKGLSDAEKSFESTSKKLISAGTTMTKRVTMPLVGIGAAATKVGGDFEQSFNKVETIMDQNVKSLQDMQKGVMNLSDYIDIAGKDLNEALYQAISATGDTANALEYVEVSAKAAIGGFTDTTTAIDGLTTVMNTYGMKGAESIAKVSDQMLMAQNFGKTTFGEMSQYIGQVVPIANALNVGTTELFGSIATLTKNGIQTSKAITGMKAAMSNIIKPTADAAEVAERLGINFSASHLQSVGWAKFLDEIKEKTGGNTETMASLFGSVEALNSMLVLTSETGSADFANALLAMEESAGATESAFEIMNKGINDATKDLFNNMRNGLIEMSNLWLAKGEEIVRKIDDWVTKFRELDDEQKEFIVKVALVVAAIGPLLLITGQTIKMTSLLIGATKALTLSIIGLPATIAAVSGALVTLRLKMMYAGDAVKLFFAKAIPFIAANPWVLVIGAIIAAVILIWKNWDFVKEKVMDIWKVMAANLQWWRADFEFNISKVKLSFFEFIQTIVDKLEPLKKVLPESWKNALEGVQKQISGKVNEAAQSVEEANKRVIDSSNNLAKARYETSEAYKTANEIAELSAEKHKVMAESLNKTAAAEQSLANFVELTTDELLYASEVTDEYGDTMVANADVAATAFSESADSIIADVDRIVQKMTGTEIRQSLDTLASSLRSGKINTEFAQSLAADILNPTKVEVPGWIAQPTSGANDPRIQEYKSSTTMQVNINVQSPAEAIKELDLLDKQLAFSN